jgi:hypothetical protein
MSRQSASESVARLDLRDSESRIAGVLGGRQYLLQGRSKPPSPKTPDPYRTRDTERSGTGARPGGGVVPGGVSSGDGDRVAWWTSAGAGGADGRMVDVKRRAAGVTICARDGVQAAASSSYLRMIAAQSM